jgi:hypothetical protein
MLHMQRAMGTGNMQSSTVGAATLVLLVFALVTLSNGAVTRSRRAAVLNKQ